jgi:hypothetical protein
MMVSAYERFANFMTLQRINAMLAIIVLAVAIHPLALPKVTVPEVQDALNVVAATIKPGDLVIWGDQEMTISEFVNQRDNYRAFIWYLADHGARIVIATFSAAAPSGIDYLIKYTNLQGKYGWVYGVNYVLLPYVTGEEAALSLMAENMWATSVDYYNTPLSELPLMANCHQLTDAKLIVTGYSGTYASYFLRQWVVKYPDDIRPKIVTWMGYTDWAAQYPRYVQGAGLRSVDTQILTGYLGEDVIKLDASNLCYAFSIIVLITGAILKIQAQRKGEKITLKPGV